ncbi:hypothetical protein BEL04_14355 [Mucilaginibacter sp. PPCGB 2223]|uniref:hypothetical protein n=1 Tax=Mucilaginibacter sp. PPCGB 2223 TaxID=1886027 RepID=UPI000825B203|nr:hypothetical protein [Mucilaginibacter sp. PPCGB 2223]OCX52626.1 hypothetical protein BEL04_14355 [Mucilaginibacter sp. PPCGB 2223]
MDSVRLGLQDIIAVNPDDIVSLTVLNTQNSIAQFGEAGRDGVIYMETKAHARGRYRKFFSSKSTEYADLINKDIADSTIQYIVNGELMSLKNSIKTKKTFESELEKITDSTFVSLKLINRNALVSDYGVTDKDYGVVIATKAIKTLSKDTSTYNQQKRNESIMLDWPDSEGWKVGGDQENEQEHVIDLVRNNETVDKWTELGNMTTIKVIKNLPIDKAMDFMFDQAKQHSPKAKLTFIEKDERAENPWIIFTIESPGFKDNKTPESQLWYIVQGKQALYTNFRAVKQASIPDALKTKWIAFFKTAKIVYKD